MATLGGAVVAALPFLPSRAVSAGHWVEGNSHLQIQLTGWSLAFDPEVSPAQPDPGRAEVEPSNGAGLGVRLLGDLHPISIMFKWG